MDYKRIKLVTHVTCLLVHRALPRVLWGLGIPRTGCCLQWFKAYHRVCRLQQRQGPWRSVMLDRCTNGVGRGSGCCAMLAAAPLKLTHSALGPAVPAAVQLPLPKPAAAAFLPAQYLLQSLVLLVLPRMHRQLGGNVPCLGLTICK